MAGANRVVKEQKVSEFNAKFSQVQAAVVATCTGVDVESITSFRRQLRDNNIDFRVIKNSIARRAIAGTEMECLSDQLAGPTAIATTTGDAVVLAKLIRDFEKAQKSFSIRVGVLNGSLLTSNQVQALADLPSREVLLGRLAGALQSPYAGMARCMAGILRKFVYALDAVRRQKEEQGK